MQTFLSVCLYRLIGSALASSVFTFCAHVLLACYKDGSPVLHRPQAVETTEEGQWSLIRNHEDTAAAAAGSGIECPVSLNISTFQGKK